jgi:ABC-type phosphate/phosphonate transport system substrate-binding protein
MMESGHWRLALPMYNVTSGLARDWVNLLHVVVDALRRRGWSGTMRIVPAPDNLEPFWRADDLLLSQTCGYPLVTQLGDAVQVLAAPEFDLPGCEGMNYCSLIVVAERNDARDLEALRGSVAVINQAHSQSGMNALRHTLAPLARAGQFLGGVRISGSHLASMAMVQSGAADVAAIDCVTYALAARHAPQSVAGLRVLQRTVSAPGLPLITSRALSGARLQDLREVLYGLSVTAPKWLAPLSLRALCPVTLDDYQPIAAQARFAVDRAYPVLA